MTSILFKTAMVVMFCFSATACGTVEKIDAQSSDYQGNSRLSTTVSNHPSGKVVTTLFYYNDAGQHIRSTGSINDKIFHNTEINYDSDGKRISKHTRFAANDKVDIHRKHLYKGDRFEGTLISRGGKPPYSAIKYQYDGDKIVGFEQRRLTKPDSRPKLGDGILRQTGTHYFNSIGQIVRLEVRDVDGGGYNVKFNVNKIGQQLGSEKRDLDDNLLYTTEGVYEDAKCVESSFATITEWLCVKR